eukprot:2820427-Amphidinium_carterae.1
MDRCANQASSLSSNRLKMPRVVLEHCGGPRAAAFLNWLLQQSTQVLSRFGVHWARVTALPKLLFFGGLQDSPHCQKREKETLANFGICKGKGSLGYVVARDSLFCEDLARRLLSDQEEDKVIWRLDKPTSEE